VTVLKDVEPVMSTQTIPAPAATAAFPWWTRGDTNAFFGLAFNILVNV
jgi:adenine/guanine/hypoxanthine permease